MSNFIEVCSIPVIASFCFAFIEVLKRTFKNDDKLKNAYPLITATLGTVMGVIAFLADPSIMLTDSVFSSALAGMASGLSDEELSHLDVQSVADQRAAEFERLVTKSIEKM